MAISVVPLVLIALFAGRIFAWMFGQTWVMAGMLASSLSIFYFFRLIVEPVSSVLGVIGEERNYFLSWPFPALALISCCLFVYASYDLIDAITLFAAANAFGHVTLAVQITLRLKRISTKVAVPLPPRAESISESTVLTGIFQWHRQEG